MKYLAVALTEGALEYLDGLSCLEDLTDDVALDALLDEAEGGSEALGDNSIIFN